MPPYSPPFYHILSMALIVSPADGERLLHALHIELSAHEPGFSLTTDWHTGACVIRGSDELHLRSICDRISREYRIDIRVGETQAILVETIRRSSEAEGKYIRQTGGSGNYGHVKIRLEPIEPGRGVEFIDEIKSGVVPKEYIKPIEQGIREAAQGGILAGFEVVDFRAILYDGSFHETDSNEMAFRIAGSLAFREAAAKASPVILEPIMKFEFAVSEPQRIALIEEIRARRGEVNLVEHSEGSLRVWAIAPLESMLGFHSPVPQARTLIGYREKPRPDASDDEGGIPVSNPRKPGPRVNSTAVQADWDWT